MTDDEHVNSEAMVHVSMTEMPHFNRLVEFMAEVEDYAEQESDYGLLEIIDQAREDLMAIGDGDI